MRQVRSEKGLAAGSRVEVRMKPSANVDPQELLESPRRKHSSSYASATSNVARTTVIFPWQIQWRTTLARA